MRGFDELSTSCLYGGSGAVEVKYGSAGGASRKEGRVSELGSTKWDP